MIDASEINRLARDLGAVPAKVGPNLRAAVEVTARNVKDDWRKSLEGSATVPLGHLSVTYDMKGGAAATGSSVEAEIGPDLARPQGPLVGIVEEGVAGRNGPRGYGLAALQRNVEDFERGLAKAVEDSL